MNHWVIAPVLLPLLAGVLLLLLRPFGFAVRRVIAVIAVAAQIGIAVELLSQVQHGTILVYAVGNWVAPYGIVLVADRLAAWLVLTTTVLALFALLHACRGGDAKGRHFHVLFQLQLFGLNGAFLTGDLFNLFVFFEILLLASYGLLLHGGSAPRTRAGLHFVVVNLLGSTLFLFAVGTLYGVLGTLNMADIARKMATVPAEHLGVVQAAGLLLFGVFALKAALLPLHLWLPAAYSSTSAAVAALFAIMTKVGAYSILRLDTLIFGTDAGGAANLLDAWLLPLALLTLLLGMLGALASTGLRRQIAWLVVASVGSLLVAFGLGSAAAIGAGLYYLPHATFAAAAFFLLAESIATRRDVAHDTFEPGIALHDARLLGGLFFALAVLVSGLPPLSGFLGKVLLLRAALDHPALPWVMAVVLGTSLLAVIALARSGSVLFYRARPDAAAYTQKPLALALELSPLTGLLLACLALVIWAGPVSEFAQATGVQLLQPQTYIEAVLGTGATP